MCSSISSVVHQTHSSGMSALASTLGALAVSASGQATVKRRKKSAAAPNPKKMFEEAQMVRRVKAYLNNIKVITDEDKLHELSLECEPSGGSAPNTVTIRKRHPSPTLSTTSSTSSTSEGRKIQLAAALNSANGKLPYHFDHHFANRVTDCNDYVMCSRLRTHTDPNDRRPPKFGAASPQAVKKLLSLSEQNKTRPHQPRQFNNLMSHVGPANAPNSFGMCPNTATSIGLGKHPNCATACPFIPLSLTAQNSFVTTTPLETPASDPTLRQASGLPSLYYHHSSSGLPTNPSPTPSTNSHRSGGSYLVTFMLILYTISVDRSVELRRHSFRSFLMCFVPIDTVSYPTHSHGFGGQTANNYTANSGIACLPTRAVHERSHSDGTTAPLPSVDLSMESSSVTSLSNLPLRKHAITSGKQWPCAGSPSALSILYG